MEKQKRNKEDVSRKKEIEKGRRQKKKKEGREETKGWLERKRGR